MTTAQRPMNEYRAVQTWLWSYADFWGLPASSVGRELAGMLDSLSRFCDLVERDPDTIIDECLGPAKDRDGLVIRVRARRHYIERIAEFERLEGSRSAANAVRSFLIHNGVAMNTSILK